jgi:hypothetical protein
LAFISASRLKSTVFAAGSAIFAGSFGFTSAAFGASAGLAGSTFFGSSFGLAASGFLGSSFPFTSGFFSGSFVAGLAVSGFLGSSAGLGFSAGLRLPLILPGTLAGVASFPFCSCARRSFALILAARRH